MQCSFTVSAGVQKKPPRRAPLFRWCGTGCCKHFRDWSCLFYLTRLVWSSYFMSKTWPKMTLFARTKKQEKFLLKTSKAKRKKKQLLHRRALQQLAKTEAASGIYGYQEYDWHNERLHRWSRAESEEHGEVTITYSPTTALLQSFL